MSYAVGVCFSTDLHKQQRIAEESFSSYILRISRCQGKHHPSWNFKHMAKTLRKMSKDLQKTYKTSSYCQKQ